MSKRVALLYTILTLFVLNNCITTPSPGLSPGNSPAKVGIKSPGESLLEKKLRTITHDSYEPDSRKKPVKIRNNNWIVRILDENDTDWFSITPNSAGLLIAETQGHTDTVLELFNGNIRLQENDDMEDDHNARIEYPVEGSTTYLIKVSGVRLAGASEGASGPYGFRAMVQPMDPDTTEPNNFKEQATPIALGDVVTGYFTDPEDIDWYSLTTPSRGRLIVYTTGTMDTILSLYDDWIDPLAYDDDSGAQGNARIVTDLYLEETVYIKVSAYQGGLGRYYLHTQFKDPVIPDQFENDNTMAQAKEIQPGSSQERNFTDASDEDWVRLRITRQGTYEIRTVAADNRLDTFIELINEDGEQIAKDDDSGGYWNALIKITLISGTYFLRITTIDKDPLENSAYTLRVSLEQ
jgi:hypothetical protein